MSNFYKIFTAISEEYNNKIALMATQIYSLSLSKVLYKRKKFQANPEEYLKSQARQLLWEETESDFELAFKLSQVIQEWETRQSFQGLGGCTAMTFKQLLNNSEIPQ